jgi:hypothetical protein
MLPWTAENQIVLQRAGSLETFDAWMRIPHNQRFHSQYLSERALKMKELLEGRLPGHKVEVVRLPAESQSTFLQLGAARHPVFPRSAQKRSAQEGIVSFHSPEHWKSLSFEGQFAHSQEIFKNLKSWWDRKEDLRKKREAKEQAKSKNQGAEL